MWTCEHAETTSATPDQLWALYFEPTTWPHIEATASGSRCTHHVSTTASKNCVLMG